jgi:hypothetical protein
MLTVVHRRDPHHSHVSAQPQKAGEIRLSLVPVQLHGLIFKSTQTILHEAWNFAVRGNDKLAPIPSPKQRRCADFTRASHLVVADFPGQPFEIPYLGKENGGESPVLDEILQARNLGKNFSLQVGVSEAKHRPRLSSVFASHNQKPIAGCIDENYTGTRESAPGHAGRQKKCADICYRGSWFQLPAAQFCLTWMGF